VTYGGSGVHIKHGISGTACIGSITKWIVSTLGGGGPSQAHLDTLLGALQSYYHPANSNGSSELLHVFISCLCTYLVDRVHLERYNKKWETKVPPDKRLTDRDIEAFVLAVKPIAFLVLYNNFEEEARAVFQSLALLAPATIIPPLLDRLEAAKDTLTEPHRFHVCVQAMSATSGPLIRHYPGRALGLLHSLLPGIDVNDIWKCTDIFVLMSDLLDNIPLTDISRTAGVRRRRDSEDHCTPAGGGRPRRDSEERCTLAGQTANFESFVVEFMNRCFTLIENSVRVNIRSDGGNTDEYLNDEEIAADAAINDTFLRMCINSSAEIFQVIFSKLRSYLSGKIVEPTVAGGILASMCKSVVQCDPAKGLAFFVPYLVRALTERVGERGSKEEEEGKVDEELQFNLQLLGEVLSVRNVAVYRTTGAHVLPFVEPLCSVLDCTLELGQRDEYELAHSVLGGVLSWLAHPRLLETGPRLRPELDRWGAMVGLEEVAMAWYRPGPQELAVVTGLLERYLLPAMETLGQFAAGKLELEKEELQRGLKLVCRVLAGVSELAEPEQEAAWESCLSSGLAWLAEVRLELPGGRGGLRREVGRLVCSVQDRMAADLSDDTDSYAAIVSVFDTLLFCYGADEDEIGDHLEDHKREKLHREDKLVRGKRHLPGVHLERVTLQWETQVWLRNLLVLESLPRATLQHIFALCIHHYSEVRVVAQELFLKLVGRVGKACHPLVIPQLVSCLKEGAADDVLKGALYMINSEKHMFFYSWEAASQIWPALVTATHSDKQSVDDLLRDIGIKANRYYQDYVLYTMPVSAPGPPSGLLELVRGRPEATRPEGGLASTCVLAGQLHYQALETALVSLVEGKALHWRHQEMAVGMLLSMVAYDTAPSQRTASLWLGLLLSDQRTIRLMAYQALEGILKLVKVRSRKAPLSELVPDLAAGGGRPGLRPDNQLLQYRDSMGPDELEAYWARPFVVKSYTGYHGWPREGKARLCHSAADFQHSPGSVLGLVADFFLDEANTARFVELNSLEHEKGSDFFSTDRGLFLSFLLENLGPRLATAFQPHIERLVGSPEESQQRAAAEMIYGVVRGSRFWDFGTTADTWAWLLPVFQQVLTSVTAETQSDWDFCFSGVSNKADPNRLRPLFELLVTPENLMSQGAFKESSYLLFVAKCLNMNWRVRGLYCRTYNILREHWAHPFTNVRHQIASTLATLTIMNSPWAGEEGGTLGEGFPTKQLFIREVIPHLSLNSPNPEFSSMSREVSPNTSNGSSEDVSMDTVEGRGADGDEGEDSETKRANRTLEMVSLWICHQIRLSSASLDPALFELLPYLCQFIGTETDQDVSQACLQALCYLSACVLPAAAIQPMLDMVGRIAHSESYKTKMSVLEFLQVAVFTNFPALVHGAAYRPQVTGLVLSLLQVT
jgi:proteasome activator subunit 4